MEDKNLTTIQAAKALNVNDSRVRQLILAGRLPAQKFGRDWLIQKKDLKLVLAEPSNLKAYPKERPKTCD